MLSNKLYTPSTSCPSLPPYMNETTYMNITNEEFGARHPRI